MSAPNRGSLLGNFSFEGDSLPEFSEFDTPSEVFSYKNERYLISTFFFTILSDNLTSTLSDKLRYKGTITWFDDCRKREMPSEVSNQHALLAGLLCLTAPVWTDVVFYNMQYSYALLLFTLRLATLVQLRVHRQKAHLFGSLHSVSVAQ